MTQIQEFRLPDLGEGLTDAELVSWRVQVGDRVALNDTIAEVETAKALVELPTPYAGTIAELLAYPGDTVAVGAPLIRVNTDAATPEQPERQAVLVGYGPEQETRTRRRKPTALNGTPDQTQEPESPQSLSEDNAPSRPDAKPKVRKLARELGVDLREITGTGPGGVITAADVTEFQPKTSSRETRTKVSGVRKRTAEAMARSARTIPQVTEFVTVDMTRSMELLTQLRETKAFAETKLTALALVSRVTLAALGDHPEINSTWDEERGEIVTKHYVNLGIAVAAARGLMVPNIKDAQDLSLLELAREIDRLSRAARDNSVTPTQLTGGTFTITNIGVFGIDAGTPIVNPGEAGILCLGSITKRPWVIDDRIEPRMLTTLALSFDHRLIDGEHTSRFLADIAGMLESPAMLLARV